MRRIMAATLCCAVAAFMVASPVRAQDCNMRAQDCKLGHGCDKVCVPVPDVKKKTRVVYGVVERDFCLPRATFCGKCCAEDGACGKVRTRHVLVKKVVTEECPSFKCVVQPRPDCAAGRTPAADAAHPAVQVILLPPTGASPTGASPAGASPAGASPAGASMDGARQNGFSSAPNRR